MPFLDIGNHEMCPYGGTVHETLCQSWEQGKVRYKDTTARSVGNDEVNGMKKILKNRDVAFNQ